MCREHGRRVPGTLQKASGADVVPALAVRHRRIGHALEEVHALHDGGEGFVGLRRPILGGSVADFDVQPVQLLPHFRADLLAHLTGVLASRGKTGGEGSTIGEVGRGIVQCEGVSEALERRSGQTVRESSPVALPVGGYAIERQVQIHRHDARRVFGALEIAAHPVKAVGYAREHDGLRNVDGITRGPRCLCCRRPETNSRRAIRAAARHASVRRERSSHDRHRARTAANRRVAARRGRR